LSANYATDEEYCAHAQCEDKERSNFDWICIPDVWRNTPKPHRAMFFDKEHLATLKLDAD
jgi:hypothetical protein